MESTMMHESFLTVGDAARIVAVVPATIRLWERSGKLPAVRTLGGVRLFHRADVERIAAARGRRRGGRTR